MVMLLAKAATVTILKGVALGFLVLAFVDPAWAVPVQTGLLIILTLLGGRTFRGVKRTEQKTEETHATVEDTHAKVLETKANATHAASAAAAAAASAATAARVAKDVGAAFRAGGQQ